MDPEHRAGEFPAGVVVAIVRGSFGILYVTVIEDAVQAIEPAVGPPGERIGKLVGVGTAEPGNDDFGLVGPTVPIRVLHEEHVWRIGDPNAAVADRDSRRNIEPFGKNSDLVDSPVAVGVFQQLHSVAPGSWL